MAGVASGDPRPTGATIWTRAVPPTGTGPVRLSWEVAADEGFSDVAATGTVTATAEGDHTATVAVARHAAERTQSAGLNSVAGGGETVAALHKAGVADDFASVSTAGGAFLEWLEGKALQGVEVLRRNA